MNKAIFSIISFTALALSTTAQGAAYTYSTTDNPSPTAVGMQGPNGQMVGATASTGTSTLKWDDGKTTTETYTCIGMTQPQNDSIFATHTMCDASGPTGTYTALFGCQPAADGGQGCVGGLYGKTGKYAGKRGQITWAGKVGKGTGTAQWND